MEENGTSRNGRTEQPGSKAIKKVEDKYVCCECIDETFLKSLVQRNKVGRECNFCGAKSHAEDIAAPLVKVVEKIAMLFDKRTRRPERDRPNPPLENGGRDIDCDPISTVAVLQGFKWTSNAGLLSYVARELERDRDWNWWLDAPSNDTAEVNDGEVLDWSWCRFTDVVMYESRFNFLTAKKSSAGGMLDIGKVLNRIGELVKEHGLVRCVLEGEEVYRARIRAPTDVWNPADPTQMGAPPREKASASRMSSAGIRHLYTAFEEETALRELVPAANVCAPVNVVLAKFRP